MHPSLGGFIPDYGPMLTELQAGQTSSSPAIYVGGGDSLFFDVDPECANWAVAQLADACAPELSEVGGPEAKAMRGRLSRPC